MSVRLGTRSSVEHIAGFAARARPEHLARDIRQLLKCNILDSVGCANAALPGLSFRALREQFEEYRAPGRCTLIGGGKASADQAALSLRSRALCRSSRQLRVAVVPVMAKGFNHAVQLFGDEDLRRRLIRTVQ